MNIYFKFFFNIYAYGTNYIIFYCQLFDTDTARRWKGLLATQINSTNMSCDGSDYIDQELEIDAFAFTKFYLEHYEGMKVVNRIDGLDKYLDLYIEKNIRIMWVNPPKKWWVFFCRIVAL